MKSVSDILKEDINEIIMDESLPWSSFADCTVLITGATGLIGRLLVLALSSANVKQKLAMRIIAHGRCTEKGAALINECNIDFISGDIRQPIPDQALPYSIDFIFHCAAITTSADMVAKPVDVLLTEAKGTDNILKLAKERSCKSIVYLSSMEVYGHTELAEVRECDLGHIDLSNPRSSYPAGKRFAEALCHAYAAQYDVPVKIARLAQTFGAGTPKYDTRVFAQFARSVMAQEDIELHTDGSSRGNYCYTTDTIRGLLTVLLIGKNGDVCNISNVSSTIYEMAKIVAEGTGNREIKVVINTPNDIKKLGYAPAAGYILNADKLKSLGWVPKYGLEDMYKRMLEDWRQCK